MKLYTIVDESYDVKIFNKKQLLEYLNALLLSAVYFLGYGIKIATLNSILLELDQCECIRLFPRDSMDWKYKIQKH